MSISWVNKLQFIFTIEYYSKIKRNKELINVTNMDESQKHSAKLKTPDTKEYRLLFHLYQISDKSRNYSDRKQISGCQGRGVGQK